MLKKFAVIVVVIFTTLLMDALILFLKPEWMVEDMILISLQVIPVVSVFISGATCLIIRKFIGISWKLAVLAIFLAVISSVAILMRAIDSQSVSNYFFHLYQQHETFSDGSSDVTGIGDSVDAMDVVQRAIPNNWRLFGIDANSDPNRYWFIALDKSNSGNTLIGFSDKNSLSAVHFQTAQQLWAKVREQEGIPADRNFTKITGIPSPTDSVSAFKNFFQEKTVNFQLTQEKFTVEISAKGSRFITHITKTH